MSERASTKGREHTPGPWVLDGHNMSSILKCVVPKGDPKACHLTGDYDIIARCFSDNWRNDARLIAAAPDLLEALFECEEYFDNKADADCDQDGFIPNKEMRLLDVVRAAIAKAEGRTNLADATPNPLSEGRERS